MVMTDKPTLISLGATFTCSRSPRTVRPLPSAAIMTLASRTIPTPAGSLAIGQKHS